MYPYRVKLLFRHISGLFIIIGVGVTGNGYGNGNGSNYYNSGNNGNGNGGNYGGYYNSGSGSPYAGTLEICGGLLGWVAAIFLILQLVGVGGKGAATTPA